MQLVYSFLYFDNRLFFQMYYLLCFHTQNPFLPPFPLWPKVILVSTASVHPLREPQPQTSSSVWFAQLQTDIKCGMSAGMTKLEVVIAHSVIQVVIAVIQQLSVLAVFYAVYDNPMIGNIYIVIVLLIMLQIMGLFYGLCGSSTFLSQ